MANEDQKPDDSDSENEELINLGSLKLPPPLAKDFLSALEHYGYEKTARFLRRAAIGLVTQHKKGVSLENPLYFKESH